ncbi:hypothetical protein SDC9_141189 [bioreactor metagenome]|uniref:Uncharacterized protein n=1 Tax=bioreactor metagenome TaxID=1076179 RepID=A0A645DXD9_9ZZZZ
MCDIVLTPFASGNSILQKKSELRQNKKALSLEYGTAACYTTRDIEFAALKQINADTYGKINL